MQLLAELEARLPHRRSRVTATDGTDESEEEQPPVVVRVSDALIFIATCLDMLMNHRVPLTCVSLVQLKLDGECVEEEQLAQLLERWRPPSDMWAGMEQDPEYTMDGTTLEGLTLGEQQVGQCINVCASLEELRSCASYSTKVAIV